MEKKEQSVVNRQFVAPGVETFDREELELNTVLTQIPTNVEEPSN